MSRDEGPSRSAAPPPIADLHTHVIPAVDDGAPDLLTALESLEMLVEDGIAAVAATPHLNASNPHGERRQRADRGWPELVARAAERFPDLRLHRGYEVQLDLPSPDLSDPELRLAGGRYVLVEWQAFTIPPRSDEVLRGIVGEGYVPVLAHPERYFGYDHDYSVVPEWRRAGALLQLNGGSLLGENGERIQRTAHAFLQRGWTDLIASDNHARPGRRPSLRWVWDYLHEHGAEDAARLLLCVNPFRILEDEDTVEVGPVMMESRGWMSRMLRALKGGG